MYLALADHIVDQEFGRGRERESGNAVDGHEAKAREQQPALRAHKGPHFF